MLNRSWRAAATAAALLAVGKSNPASGALDIEFEPRFGDAQHGGADIDAENAIARRAVERTSVVRVAGRGTALEMPDRQRAMLGNEDLRDDDVVARRAFQADRPPGIDDLDLAARQGVVTVDIDAILLGEGGEQAPVAGIDAADQRPTARQYVATLDTAPAPAGGNEDAADQAGRILPYVVLSLVGPLPEHKIGGEMRDQPPGARAAASAHGGQGFDATPHIGFATAEPCRLIEAGRARRVQVPAAGRPQ